MSIGIDGGQKTRSGIAMLRRTVVVRRCWEGGGLRHPISRYMYELFLRSTLWDISYISQDCAA